MGVIDATAINVILPVMQTDLGATLTELQWFIEVYALFLAAFLLVGGAELPPGLTSSEEAELSDAIDEAFLDAFQTGMYIASALAFTSAMAALVLLERQVKAPGPPS
jgi:hypothetical protein